MSVYMFVIMFGMLSVVTGAAAVDGTRSAPGMYMWRRDGFQCGGLVADVGACCTVSYPQPRKESVGTGRGVTGELTGERGWGEALGHQLHERNLDG